MFLFSLLVILHFQKLRLYSNISYISMKRMRFFLHVLWSSLILYLPLFTLKPPPPPPFQGSRISWFLCTLGVAIGFFPTLLRRISFYSLFPVTARKEEGKGIAGEKRRCGGERKNLNTFHVPSFIFLRETKANWHKITAPLNTTDTYI